ncbi:MAG: RNA polymerase sigma factor [Planctomycetia bacterium]|nr:RNA polymerase sigma factor [Planctomycetia bacterium]
MALVQAQFQRMVTDHGPSLYRMAYRMVGDAHEAEDIVQDTYRSAWQSRNRYDSDRSERAWLVAILRRRVVDRWRGRPRPTLLADPDSLQPEVAPVDPLADYYTDEMQRALDQLSPELRESLLLVVVAELTHQETADLLEIPLGTVLSRVSRARERLRKALLAAAE